MNTKEKLFEDEQTLLKAVTILEAYGNRRAANKVRKQLRYVTKMANAAQDQF